MLASEYGWDIPTILALPCDQVQELTHAILYRKGVKVIKRDIGEARGSLAERMRGVLDTLEGKGDEWLLRD